MPNQPKTTARTVRVEDDLWERVGKRAAERGESVSDATRKFYRRYVR
jgi:hypothetical protein